MRIKNLTRIAVMIALSYLGSFITPFPGPVSTAALDSMPGFFTAVYMSPINGAIVGAFGHFFTALLHGFPLTLPVHLVLSVQMAIICALFGFLWKKNRVAAVIISSILNGVVSPLSLAVFKHLSLPLLWTLVPTLLFASVFNIVVASLLLVAIPKTNKKVNHEAS